jgi:response regulator of citrate/malate metabolism
VTAGAVTVGVLVVEDEALSAEVHADYVRRTPGFEVSGVARSSVEAMRHLRAHPVDLMLLDMHLPDGHGLGLLHKARSEGFLCDVIAVTAARDVEVVKRAVSQGVVLYLLKPFTYASFRGKLEQYADYRERLEADVPAVGQDDVDQMLGVLRTTPAASALPKGMSADTLREVTATLRAGDAPLSATEVAAEVGASRVTVRRYLEYLAGAGLVERGVRYGGSGRPEVEYHWVGA